MTAVAEAGTEQQGWVRTHTVRAVEACGSTSASGAGPTGRRFRANLAAREIDGDDVLRALEVPVLVTHGREDSVVLPTMAEHVLAICPVAEPSWYERVAHAPHLEEPECFNRELAALTRRVRD